MTEQRLSHVRLGDYLDDAVDQALALLQHRNPELRWDREQLIRLTVGYGLTRLFRQQTRVALTLTGTFKHLYADRYPHDLIVDNLSHGGIGFRTLEDHVIQVNEVLLIELMSQDEPSILVETHVLVKHVQGRAVGAAFAEPELRGKLERLLLGN